VTRAALAFLVLLPVSAFSANPEGAGFHGGEFAKRWAAAGKLALAVAGKMPAADYGFRAGPGSMSFGEQIAHIAQTNYAFCAGLKDSKAPAWTDPSGREPLIQALSDSFSYCSTVISGLTEAQADALHSSPDGTLTGRECLLAMFVHVAHHRGQAEVYLRAKGIQPPQYLF
jgi:uncharacterized damage-inducible protein DinB